MSRLDPIDPRPERGRSDDHGDIAVRGRRAREAEAMRHLADSLGVAYVDLDSYSISPGILRRLPPEVARRHRCVPMVCNPRRIVLVFDDPARALWLTSDPARLGPRVLGGRAAPRRREWALTSPSALDRWIARREELPV